MRKRRNIRLYQFGRTKHGTFLDVVIGINVHWKPSATQALQQLHGYRRSLPCAKRSTRKFNGEDASDARYVPNSQDTSVSLNVPPRDGQAKP